MTNEKNEVQLQIEQYEKTGKYYFAPKDANMDFSKCDEKPKDEKPKDTKDKK